MTHFASPLAAHFTPRRQAIYTEILAAPDTDWTVAALATSLAITQDSARATLYVLLTDGLMTQVPGHRALTLRLTDDGTQALTALLDTWRHTNTQNGRRGSLPERRANRSSLLQPRAQNGSASRPEP
jgi:hypothetical protein